MTVIHGRMRYGHWQQIIKFLISIMVTTSGSFRDKDTLKVSGHLSKPPGNSGLDMRKNSSFWQDKRVWLLPYRFREHG